MEDNGKKVIQISLSKFIILIILLIVVLVLGVGIYVNQKEKTNNKSDMQAIEEKEKQVDDVSEGNELSQYIDNEKMGVEFSYPENWYNISNEENSATIRSSKTDELAVLFEVRAIKNENKLSIKEWLLQEENNDINYKIQSSGEETVGGYDAWFVTGNIDVEENHMYRTIYVNVDNVMYEIIYGGDENLYNEFYNTYENILKTVKFKEPISDKFSVNNDEEKNDKKEETNKNNEQKESDLYGDVDCNGEINDSDAVCLEKYLAGWEGYLETEQAKKNADVYKDGEINKKDSLALKKYLANEYESLPVKE